MKSPKTHETPARWYAPDEKAQKRMLALGVPKSKIYTGWTKTECWGRVTMRKGEMLGVLDGLQAFGKTERPVKQAVAHFHGQGATIIDIETGKDSRTHGITMLDEITKPPKPSAEYLAKMKEERREAWRQRHGVMPKAQAYAIWRHPVMSVHEKLKLMDGWTKDMAYQAFKETGRPAGRRPKQVTA